MLEILLLGFLIGLWHALDIDHIAAMITIVAAECGSQLRSVVYGIFWGVGHATMLILVVLVTMTFNLHIQEQFSWIMELIVAVMLIFLALDLIKRLSKVEIHAHAHDHQHFTDKSHTHVHVHMKNSDNGQEHHAHSHYHGYFGRALLVGLIHGTAGSAVLTLIVLQTFDSQLLGILYAILFGVGSTLGMMLLTVIISAQLHCSHLRSSELGKTLRGFAAVVTLCVGIFLMIKAGFSAGLFMMV